MGVMKCDYCGKFIRYSDFDAGLAHRVLVTPDSHFSREEYSTYHSACELTTRNARTN